MNTRDHRPGSVPKVLALLLALLILVSAVANAPGWMRAQAPQYSVAPTLTPQVIAPAVEPVAVLAMAEPIALDQASGSVVGSDSDSISHGSDTAEAIELTLAAQYENEALDWEEPVTADTTMNPLGGRRIRLAARTGAAGGSSHAASGGQPSAGSGSSGAPANDPQGPNSEDTRDSSTPDQPAPPAEGGSPPHATEPNNDAPREPGTGVPPSTEPPPPASIGDGAPADAGTPSDGDSSTPDPKPPVDDVVNLPPDDRTPIDLLPTAPPAPQPVSVPEPASLGLLLLGLAGIAGTRRRRATTQR